MTLVLLACLTLLAAQAVGVAAAIRAGDEPAVTAYLAVNLAGFVAPFVILARLRRRFRRLSANRRRFAFLAVVATVLAVALTACGASRIIGTVVAKEVKPGYTYVWNQPIYITICTTTGKTTSCRQQLSGFIPWVMYQPPCYQLTVETEDDGRKNTCVHESDWDGIKVGDHYDSEPWKPDPVKDHRK